MIGRYAFHATDALAQALQADGAALLESVLPQDVCDAARRHIDALTPLHWDEVHDRTHPGGTGRHLDRYLCVFNRDPFWLGLLDRPGVIELAEAALGSDCHVIGQTAWRSHPGYRSEPLHVDYLPLTLDDAGLVERVRVPPFIITAHFYLSDVAHACAPTRLVPGSHRAARAPRPGETAWNGRGEVAVLARAGDGLLFRSDVWHAGSDNTSGATRYLLQVHYGRREMAQHFSPYLDWRFEPRVLATASRRQRRLLGDHDSGPYD